MDWTFVIFVCLVGLLVLFIGQHVLCRRVVTTIEERIRGSAGSYPKGVYVYIVERSERQANGQNIDCSDGCIAWLRRR